MTWWLQEQEGGADDAASCFPQARHNAAQAINGPARSKDTLHRPPEILRFIVRLKIQLFDPRIAIDQTDVQFGAKFRVGMGLSSLGTEASRSAAISSSLNRVQNATSVEAPNGHGPYSFIPIKYCRYGFSPVCFISHSSLHFSHRWISSAPSAIRAGCAG